MNKPIFEMTGRTDLDTLLTKINDSSDVNIINNYSNTALILASRWGYIDICKVLIENGVDLNIQNKYEETALILASAYGYIEICKILIENKADVNIKNYDGETALMRSSYSRHPEICKLLLENGADINIKNKYGDAAIDYMEDNGIYENLHPIINRMEGLKYFKEVFKEYAESYMDIFETTLYSQDLEIDDIKANIEMFYSNVVTRMDNNTISENVEL